MAWVPQSMRIPDGPSEQPATGIPNFAREESPLPNTLATPQVALGNLILPAGQAGQILITKLGDEFV